MFQQKKYLNKKNEKKIVAVAVETLVAPSCRINFWMSSADQRSVTSSTSQCQQPFLNSFIYLFISNKKVVDFEKSKWSFLCLSSWSLPRCSTPTMPSSTAWEGSSATSAGCSDPSRRCFRDSRRGRVRTLAGTASASAAEPTRLRPPAATSWTRPIAAETRRPEKEVFAFRMDFSANKVGFSDLV